MKPERIQIFPSIEKWELVPAQGRISLPCNNARDASFLVGAASHLVEKFGLAHFAVTADPRHVVAVSFEIASHEGFNAREQELSERIEDLWSILTEPVVEPV